MQQGKQGIIYKYTSPSGKVYVGQTTDEQGRRWDHQNETGKKKSKFGKAINKYGFQNLEYKVLYKTILTEDISKLKRVLDKMETAYIEFYNSYENGYNLTLGGEGHLGYIHTEETKLKISKSNTGKKRSEESKLKMSNSQLGKSCIKVHQFTKEGEFIKEWSSMLEATKELGISAGSISRCCAGKAKTVKGFIWKSINTSSNE